MNATLKSALLSATVLLVSSSAFASNMGFKLVFPLKKPTAGVHDGSNWISLPYFNSFATQNAAGIWADLPASKQVIFHYDTAGSFYDPYSGQPLDNNWAITKGEAYLVGVTADANWTIVGSHDNAYAVPLKKPTAGVHDGSNWVSVPYHTTAANAAAIWASLPASKQVIFKYDTAGSFYDPYSGQPLDNNWAVTIGEAYLIGVTADTTWTPAHY
jgi:hypothetical protein